MGVGVEDVYVHMWVDGERGCGGWEGVQVCGGRVCVWGREVHVCEWCVGRMCVCVCVHVCTCTHVCVHVCVDHTKLTNCCTVFNIYLVYA